MNTILAGNKRVEPGWLIRVYIYSVVVVFGLIGTMLLVAGLWSDHPFLQWRDAFLGLNDRLLLILVGVIHLALCGCLLATQGLANQMMLLFWVGLNHLLYRAGMAWAMHVAAPFPALKFLGWRYGIDPGTMDIGWKFLIVYLMIGGFARTFVGFQHLKQLKNETWFKQWQERRTQQKGEPAPSEKHHQPDGYTKISCSYCGQKITFPSSRIGESIACPHCQANIVLHKPNENLKMTCILCGGRIAYPAHSLGQKIQCPHCGKSVTLLTPA
jgi:DNA-directed RNA polymerase subunit RPC12/RpoP